MDVDSKLFKIAYKKLKSSVYFDRTQILLRDKLVQFEANIDNIDKYLENFAENFFDNDKSQELINEIISTISYSAFPKTLISEKSDIIKNYSKSIIEVEDNQYFISMDVRGHILGVLWLMLIGYRVDNKIYNHSYGNRIRKNLYNELSESPTYSPYLFEPYFQQYESWRDKAMDEAQKHLHSGKDTIVLTLDFKRFFYSIDISKELMDEIYNDTIEEIGEDENEKLKIINDFIYNVIVNYAAKFDEFNGLNILPIGFLPSNVLANYALRNFDQAILDGWNPIYFGRYVDDVIIVDKIEKNSDLYKKAQKDELSKESVISFFLEQCTSWNRSNEIKCNNESNYALLHKIEKTNDTDEKDIEAENKYKYEYFLNKRYNPMEGDKSKIVVKNDKVKIFYFKNGESDALITCFKENIAKNKSEFRHMPEDESVFQKDDYDEIYDLQNEETINKFRGITGLSIDKFELSKLLGKHLRIGGMISDAKEMGIENQILKIFNAKVIIENYGVWEKIIEILVINESFATLHKFVDKVSDAIQGLFYENDDILDNEKESLFEYLLAVLSRSLALVWGKDVDEFIDNLCKNFMSRKNNSQKILYNYINSQRKAYCKIRMIDKSVMPVFIDMLQIEKIFNSLDTVNLTNFNQMVLYCKDNWENSYLYYPFLLTMYDFSMITCIEELKKPGAQFKQLENIYKRQIEDYVTSNYKIHNNTKEMKEIIRVDKFEKEIISSKSSYLVSINSNKKDKLRIAIANVCLKHDNFERVVKENPNRSYKRYKDTSKIINAALDEKADMLIMPESFMPIEWITTVARTCARNKLALVTGIEHIKIDDKIFNLTAVMLPYNDLENKSVYISFHLKTHYAPAEKQEINGYRLKEITGENYELYKWCDCYFPVYCCYELTSIVERAMFQSYADFLVAIEWNKDVNYYSNILESLSRDIHCYCVQVNSSDYGDSRITKPSKTIEKDLMRTKGGINSTILIDEIDIKQIREFQFKEYELQTLDKRFKPTPPGFKTEVVLKKIKGEKF